DRPPPNAIIASQQNCPQEMTRAGFGELCVLPLGFKLQWRSILRQLHAPSVVFNQLSTFVFHAQCINQAGPPKTNDISRESHAIANPAFSQELMGGVITATSRVAASWQLVQALQTFILTSTNVEIRNDFRLPAARCALISMLSLDMDHGHISTALHLRPLEKPWDVPEQLWTLVREAAVNQWQLQQDNTTVISLRTATPKTLAGILGTLEKALVPCLSSPDHKRLDIELLILRSRFYLKAGDTAMRWRDFRGMAIDENQEIGTLVGLFNKLVLTSTSSPPERIVMVPNGNPQVERTPGHVSVHIIESTKPCLSAYRVDTLLGCLVDGGDLVSKLFLCLPHALTAFCMPDELTSWTGIEEALRILRSAAVRSANGFTKVSSSILTKIAALTPKREVHPQAAACDADDAL
ncbi:uncharacterized protein B0I36DRAFT_254694, partial [Microdochium trichocladiopsis]